MNTTQKTPIKVTVNMRLTKAAHDALEELTTPRGVGDLVSRLIVEHYRQKKGNPGPSPRETANILRNLADRLDPE